MAKVRIQIDVSQDKAAELDRLQKLCGLETRKDLINNALTLFAWAVKQVGEGKIVASVDERNDRYRELQMPALQTAAQRLQAEQETAEEAAALASHG